MRKVPLVPQKQGSEEIPQSTNADMQTQKMWLTGFNVSGFRRPPATEQKSPDIPNRRIIGTKKEEILFLFVIIIYCSFLFWRIIFGNYYRKLYSIKILGEFKGLVLFVLGNHEHFGYSYIFLLALCGNELLHCNPNVIQDCIFSDYSM